MRYAVLIVSSLVAIATASAAGAPAPRASTLEPGWDETAPRWSPDGSAILVQRDWQAPRRGDLYHLVAVERRGQRRRIGRSARTGYEEWDTGGEWSPDGAWIAFTRSVGLGQALHVYVARADGPDQRRISPVDAEDHSPTWAPDGRRLAFVRGDRIATAPVEGGNATVITGGDDHSPRWSPDGRWIAFLRQSERSGSEAVFLVRPDGSRLTRLTDDGDYELGGWSPDSTRLVVVVSPDVGEDLIVVLHADGSYRLALEHGTAPAWSPSGDSLAYFKPDGIYLNRGPRDKGRRVYRFAERRSVNDERAAAPDWSPDGRKLAFAQRGGCVAWGAYVLDLATGRAERVTNDCHIVGSPRRDVLRGTHERDVVRALGGNDVVDGNPADRRNEYFGRLDDDLLDGGPGADDLRGRRGHDVLHGGAGDDRLRGERGPYCLFGGAGDDVLVGGRYYDRLEGGVGADRFFARDGLRDRIFCGPGRDRVSADGRDTVARDCERVTRA